MCERRSMEFDTTPVRGVPDDMLRLRGGWGFGTRPVRGPGPRWRMREGYRSGYRCFVAVAATRRRMLAPDELGRGGAQTRSDFRLVVKVEDGPGHLALLVRRIRADHGRVGNVAEVL